MAGKPVTFGPVALTTTTTTDILKPGTTTGGTGMPEGSVNLFFLIKHIRVVNTAAAPVSFALWKDATGGNTVGNEVIAGGVASAGTLTRGVSVAVGSSFDWYAGSTGLLLSAADTNKVIVGGASAAGLTFEAEGEIGVV